MSNRRFPLAGCFKMRRPIFPLPQLHIETNLRRTTATFEGHVAVRDCDDRAAKDAVEGQGRGFCPACFNVEPPRCISTAV